MIYLFLILSGALLFMGFGEGSGAIGAAGFVTLAVGLAAHQITGAIEKASKTPQATNRQQ